MTTEIAEAKAALSRIAAGTNHAGDIRAVRVAIERLDALSTPPADDVRGAMLGAVCDVLADAFSDAVTERIAADILSRLSATHEVRPRGTVTDVEVAAALDAYLDGAESVDWQPGAMRAALEAARGVRS